MENTKSAFIAIIGLPNVGKSSLMNRLVGQKISIVSNKPQTTRNKITGILTCGDVQLVFLDSPGFHKTKNKLGEYMLKQVKESILDIDVCILMVDATNKCITDSQRELINKVKKLNIDVILVINKIDLLPQKELIIKIIDLYAKELNFKSAIPISVKKDDGVDILLKELFKYALPSPHFFSKDLVTDQMEKVVVSEIIREKILLSLNKEIPHGVAVVIESMKKRKNRNLIDVEAVIYCEKESHKGIIIGKNGEALKLISCKARVDIEKLLGEKVNLQCWVKTKNNWRKNINMMNNLGYKLNS